MVEQCREERGTKREKRGDERGENNVEKRGERTTWRRVGTS